jgi:hypothetical protein
MDDWPDMGVTVDKHQVVECRCGCGGRFYKYSKTGGIRRFIKGHRRGNDRTPAPGCAQAVSRGCTCPRMDNEYGLGYLGREGVYVILASCPLHGKPPWNA